MFLKFRHVVVQAKDFLFFFACCTKNFPRTDTICPRKRSPSMTQGLVGGGRERLLLDLPRGCIERVSRSRDCLEWRFSPYHDIIFFPLLFYFYNILRFLADWNFSTNAFEAFFSFLTTTTTHGMMLFQYLKWRAPEAFCTPMLFGGWLVGSIHVHVLEIAQPCVFFCCYSRSFCPFSTDSLL